MTTLLTKAGLGAVLAATTLTAAAPAEAQWRRGYYRDRDNSGTAVVAGIAGLAIGAALASGANDRRYRERWYRSRGYDPYYDDRFYRQRGFYPNDGYYAHRYRGWGNCWTERRFDPYYGHPVRVRVCG